MHNLNPNFLNLKSEIEHPTSEIKPSRTFHREAFVRHRY